MIYELRVTIYNLDQSDFDDVLDKLQDLKPSMTLIHPGQPDQQCSVIEVIENHHDDSPNGPCHILGHWDNCPLATTPPPPPH